MESNGKPGKIHISQKTADYLEAAEKGHWIIRRTEQITAKGKGQLQSAS
jgi:class 3 adenylate cyclase